MKAERINISEAGAHVGETVQIPGWLYNMRKSGKIVFPLLRDGKLYLVLGSPGGPTIINTVLEVFVNVVDFGMNIADAVDAPRFHHQWMPDALYMETGFSPDTIALLKARGYTIKMVNAQGEVAAIMSENGWLEGSADPRTEGTARGY